MKKDISDNTPPRLSQDPLLPPLAARIVRLLEFYTRQTIAELDRDYSLRNDSLSAIKKHLHCLVESGHIRRHGRGKATWYTL